MRSIYTGFAPYGGADTFFAGANTGRGFIGVYDTIADEGAREHVYIIKGASGTGKSTLMRKIAEEAETAGYPVRRYLCGSDPTSLDAVVLDERIVVLDGTAPHSRDMVYPGAASSLIDVSRFWKRDRLAENRAELVACGAEKKAAFAAGTRYLAAAEMAEEESHEAMARCVDREKLERFCTRTAPKKGTGTVGRAHAYRTHGIGMRGLACTTGPAAAERYGIADGLGAGTVLLAALENAFCGAEIDMSIRPGWFYHANEEPHSLERLMKTYIHSCGGNTSFNLNIPPMPNGRFDERDVARLRELGEALDDAFGEKKKLCGEVTCTPLGDSDTQCVYHVELPAKTKLSYITLREDISHGQRIEHFTILAGGGAVYHGTTVGHRQICPVNVETKSFDVRIESARDTVYMRDITAYKA